MTTPALALLAAPREGGSGMYIFMVQMLLIFAIFYFLLIRPQAKERARQDAMLKGFTRRNDPVAMHRLMMDSVLPGGDLGDELRALSHPTLIIRGEQDMVVPDHLNRELVELLPHAIYEECPAVGHSVAIEAPEWFTEQLRTHLAV